MAMKRKKNGKWPKPGTPPHRPSVIARRAFNRRLAKQYREAEPSSGAASTMRSLSGDELAARRAELEARGLPPTKKVVLPKPKKIFIPNESRQYFNTPLKIVTK